MPHNKRNISSSHTMRKATVKFKARGGKCQCADFSATSEGQRLALHSFEEKRLMFPTFQKTLTIQTGRSCNVSFSEL